MRHFRQLTPTRSPDFNQIFHSVMKYTVHVKKCQDELHRQVNILSPDLQRYVECLEEQMTNVRPHLTNVTNLIFQYPTDPSNGTREARGNF